MNTFCQIIHKQTAESNELYKHKMNKVDHIHSFEFSGVAGKYEYNIECTATRLLKMLHFVFAASPIACTTKTKFDYLKTILDNIFIDNDMKEKFLNGFSRAQKSYNALCKLAYKYKYKRAILRVQTDLFLNPIDASKPNVMTIFQTGQKFLFTIGDLKRIIDTSLSNSYIFFSVPLSIKNPYNNIPFSKSILYNIYYYINRHNFVMSPAFHAYFMSNFNLTVFRNENEVLIRKMYITQCLTNGNEKSMVATIHKMICKYGFDNKIVIDKDFPVKPLIEIMRPYLKLYLTGNYSLDMNIKHISVNELHYRLRAFFRYNPIFGRKYIKYGKKMPLFNDKHIPFKRRNIFKNYENSHFNAIDENEYEQSEDESDNSNAPANHSNNDYDDDYDDEDEDEDEEY